MEDREDTEGVIGRQDVEISRKARVTNSDLLETI